MAGDSVKRNQSLYCQYHKDHEHTTEDCRNLRKHLDQLVQEGKLGHFLHHSSGHQGQANQEPRGNVSLRPPIGTINVIFAAPGRTGSYPSRVMSVARLPADDSGPELKIPKMYPHPVLSFSEIMYPDLYKGLRLTPEDLTPYNSPLMSLMGRWSCQRAK